MVTEGKWEESIFKPVLSYRIIYDLVRLQCLENSKEGCKSGSREGVKLIIPSFCQSLDWASYVL